MTPPGRRLLNKLRQSYHQVVSFISRMDKYKDASDDSAQRHRHVKPRYVER